MSITFETSVMKNVNFAACHQGAKVISSIQLKGEKGQQAILTIRSLPKFIYEYKQNIYFDKNTICLNDLPIHLDDAFYRQEVLEGREGTIQIEITDGKEPDKVLAFEHVKVRLQPYLHWNKEEYEGSLTAFMQPNDPLVARVLNRASELANEEEGRMVGYQTWKNSSVKKQAEWIYRALQEEVIHYLCPPAGFEFGQAGQKVRIPGMILHDEVKQGTCLDLAVLYASCLEAASLHSLLFLVKGHAFAGVWLSGDKMFNNYPHTDWTNVRQLLSDKDGLIMPVECTLFTDQLNCNFDGAVASAMTTLNKEEDFRCVLDVYLGRIKGMATAYTFTDQPICDLNLGFTEVSIAGTDKFQRLLRQAMDFSMKNPLLNQGVLSEEIRFTLNSNAFFTNGFSDAAIHKAMLSNGKQAENEDKLYNFYTEQRQHLQETGHGNIYMTLNELEWVSKDQKEVFRAPVYLIPAEIYRNIRGEHNFRVHTEAMFLNPVLKAFLQQEYGIDLNGLADHPGKNYVHQMETLKYAIGKYSAWCVIENTAGMASYKVQNQAVWKGLQNPKLREHDIVRGFLDGAMTWDNDVVHSTDNDQQTIYAFQADGSQREVIRSTFKKRAQVVVGPAGNGKSQTIANVITEHMRNGEKVLFVTEKPAAMKVVADLLDRVGFTPFYLMMPDGKGNVAGVHEKVEETLRFIANYHREHRRTKYAEKLFKDAADQLKGFHNQGDSLAELLDEYVEYPVFEKDIPWHIVGNALNHPNAEAILRSFTESMNGEASAYNVYMPYLKGAAMSENERLKADVLVERALDKFNIFSQKAEQFAKTMKMSDMDGSKESLKRVMSYALALGKCPVYGAAFKVTTKKQDESLDELLCLTREYMKSTPGSYHYENVGEILWNKVDNSTIKANDPNAWGGMDIFTMSNPYGGLTREQMEQMKKAQTYKKYVETLLNLAAGRPDKEKENLEAAAVQIVQGKGEEILEQIHILNSVYKAYAEAQKTAENAILNEEQNENFKIDVLKAWKFYKNRWTEIKRYSVNMNKAKDADLVPILHILEDKIGKGEMDCAQVIQAFRKARCKYNIEQLCKNHPEWKDFPQMDYQVCVQLYHENENVLRNQYRKDTVDRLVSLMPDLKEGSADDGELGVLQRLIRRKGKQTSMHQLFEEARGALLQLFPCVMMGPENVAEYLTMQGKDFDMVIFDEASQLASYKAMIPISRGFQCLFFGDEKQLTPTSFFRKNTVDVDGTETPEESILEDAIITSMPQKLLRYHYRSQHENLVAFSNSRYYHNEIATFPECDTQMKGVEYVFVEDGCYDRGGERNNAKEAERVIELIGEIYEKLPENTTDSLGVITFNLEQMKLVRKMIRQAIHDNHPQRRAMEELVDVVNLEACQGKEWDRTILSTAYGPDASGHFSTNLGPLTRDDGGNRLNVMITRSRKQLYVVTSMTPDMFGDEQKAGNRDFKDFLAFAKGDLKMDKRQVGVPDDMKGLGAVVAKALEAKGYTVHTNIGSSSCKVDLGVTADDGESYKLGILLDHFEHGNYDVYDEEVILPEMLKQKGWKIYRLHSINWYENPAYEMSQIEKMMK